MTERVKCIDCDNMILPQTATANNGLCGQCVKFSQEEREERRERERQLKSGEVFRPSAAELATASLPDEILTGKWELQPEYYADVICRDPRDIVNAACAEASGDVFLVTNKGGQLNLGFTPLYGVCEYQNQETGEYRFAHSEGNLREQVSAEHHVVQACPCCGVGMLYYPSRYHMPREHAFSVMDNAISNRRTANVTWLEMSDISFTDRGRG